MLSVVTIAVCIVAAALGAGASWLAGRAGASGAVALFFGLLVFALAFAAGPGLFS